MRRLFLQGFFSSNEIKGNTGERESKYGKITYTRAFNWNVSKRNFNDLRREHRARKRLVRVALSRQTWPEGTLNADAMTNPRPTVRHGPGYHEPGWT